MAAPARPLRSAPWPARTLPDTEGVTIIKLKRDDCTLDPDGAGVYHVKPAGYDTYTATIKRFTNNGFARRWGVRRYGDNDSLWIWRTTAADAVTAALTMFHVEHPEKTA